MILHPTKTLAGRNATFNASHTGINLNLTHMAIGDVGGAIDDSRTALRSERERVVVFGEKVGTDQIHLDGVFDGAAAFWVREVGIFAGSTLVYYWSASGTELGYKSAGFEWILGLDLALDAAADGMINVTALAPNVSLTTAPYLATVLHSLCSTNRLVLQQHYLTT